ncbi:MAG: cation:dicarboxylate symporter family transporter, partial [Phycisphaerales bacterium]
MSNAAAPSPHGRLQTILLFAGLLLGIAVGQWMHVNGISVGAWWNTAGELFLLRPLQMIVVPLVVLSVATGIASIGEPSRLGLIGSATVGFYVCSMLVAATLGAVCVAYFQPGAGWSPAEVESQLRQGGEAFTADATRAPRMAAGASMGLGGAWQSVLR